MLKKENSGFKRWVSGFLASVMMFTLIFSNASIISAFAADSSQDGRASASDAIREGKVTLKNKEKEDVEIVILSDNAGYEAGEQVCLDMYIRNNTDETITDGRLKYSGSGIIKEEAYFEDLNELKPVKESLEAEPESLTEESRETGEEPESPEESEENVESESPEKAEENLEPESPDEGEEEADWENEFGIDDSDEDERRDRLEDLVIEPGESYYVNFYYTISDDIEGIKSQKLNFTFDWKKDGKVVSAKESFYYGIGAMNLLPVTFSDEGKLEAGEEAHMHLDFDLGELEDMLMEAEMEAIADEEEENAPATPSDADKASSSNAWVKWDDDPDGNKKKNGEKPIIRQLKCQVETYGIKLNGFKVVKPEDEDNYGTSVKAEFRVSNQARIGTYFGKVTAIYQFKNKKYQTSQGFTVMVTGEGEITLNGKLDGAEVVVNGSAGSFPEGDVLKLKVSEVPEEKLEMVQEAIEQKAQESGIEVSRMKALDIKVIADGKEKELLGDVDVTFSNIKLEAIEDVMKEVNERKETEAEASGEVELEGQQVDAPAMYALRAVEEEEGTEENLEAEEEQPQTETKSEYETENENEEPELAVWHLDEEAGVLNDMGGVQNDNGDMTMTTNHFSIFILVDMNQLGGQITLRVQHWAEVSVLNGESGSDVQIVKKSNSDKYEVKRDTEFRRIYLDDELTLDNRLETKVEALSKICIDNSRKEITNYDLSEIWILNPGIDPNNAVDSDWDKKTLESKEVVCLKNDSTIRMIYIPVKKDDAFKQDVTFYDYNVTDGIIRSGNKINTSNQGINNDSNYAEGTAKNRIAVGQNGTGIMHSYADSKTDNGKLLNRNQASAEGKHKSYTEGMVTGISENGPIYSGNVNDAGLFDKKSLKTGKKVFDPEDDNNPDKFKLAFNQNGDTYMLSHVFQNGDSIKSLGDLTEFEYTGIAYGTGGNTGVKAYPLYTNNFWPLDDVTYDEEELKDPMFGEISYHALDGQKFDGTPIKGYSTGKSDDGKAHNWYFGMRYDFDFTLGDYDGPLRYYFRGDDDFWLFVDGELKTDIGGIHSSIGQIVDLDYLKNQDRLKRHKLTVIYAERGGTGSCCYMEFTLPNVEPVTFDTTVTKKKLNVKKIWDGYNGSYRPSIKVKLLYRDTRYGSWNDYKEYILTSADASEANENIWEKALGEFPAEGYEYKIEEVGMLDQDGEWKKPSEYKGYTVWYDDDNGDKTSNVPVVGSDGTQTITNSMTPKVKVRVEKAWDDKNNQDGNRPDSVDMQLQYIKVKNSTATPQKWLDYPGDTGSLTLNGVADAEEGDITGKNSWEEKPEGGRWVGIFENLPYYIDGEAVIYRVREMKRKSDGFEVLLSNNDKLPGKKTEETGKSDWVYTVTYEDEPTEGVPADGDTVAETTVTNTYTPKVTERHILKMWDGVPSGMNPSAEIGLWRYIESGQNDEQEGTAESTPEKTVVWELVSDYAQRDGNYITCIEKNDTVTEKSDFILNLISPDLSGGWKELPQYENGKKIHYAVYECGIGEAGKKVPIIPNKSDQEDAKIVLPEGQTEGVIAIIGGYQYKVTETGTGLDNKNPITIKNTFLPAKLIIKKQIVDDSGRVIDNPNDLSNEPINSNYKFMIQLFKGSPGDGQKEVYTSVALGHDEASGTVYLTPPESGEDFWVDEIVPMEYEVYSIVKTKTEDANGPIAAGDQRPEVIVNKGFSVKPGDTIEILVSNKPEHKNYFHHTASVTNQRDSGTGEFSQKDNVYKEQHGWDSKDNGGPTPQPDTVDLSAIVEDKETKWKERELGEGVALYG